MAGGLGAGDNPGMNTTNPATVSNEQLQAWYDDPCPRHGTPFRKQYEFGRYADATVTVFRGCNCAVSVNEASMRLGVPLGNEVRLHADYASAACRARLIVAGESIDNAALGG